MRIARVWTARWKESRPRKCWQRAGWARSVGGVSPYLTLFSRAGITPRASRRAPRNSRSTNCRARAAALMFSPRPTSPLGSPPGKAFDGEMKTAVKLGVTEKEIDKLCDAVLAALEKGPLDPDGLREACRQISCATSARRAKRKASPPRSQWRSKSCRPPATSAAFPANGRFDQQRYQYALWRPNPLRAFKLSPEQVQTELARRYFAWIGPASLAGFQTFSGLGVKAAKAALEPLKLEPIEIAPGDERLFLPGERAKFDAFKTPKEAALLTFRQHRFAVSATSRHARSQRRRGP